MKVWRDARQWWGKARICERSHHQHTSAPAHIEWSRSTRLLTARLDLVLPGISTLQEDFLPIHFIRQFLLTHAKCKKFDIKTSGWGKRRSRAWRGLRDDDVGCCCYKWMIFDYPLLCRVVVGPPSPPPTVSPLCWPALVHFKVTKLAGMVVQQTLGITHSVTLSHNLHFTPSEFVVTLLTNNCLSGRFVYNGFLPPPDNSR